MISLEKVNRNSIDKLAGLANEIWHEYWVGLLSNEQIEYMIEKFQSKDAIENQILNEDYIYFFIKQNDEIIGYTGLSDKKDYLFLSKLYIKKDFRHKGFGKMAFELIKDFAYKKAFKKIRLTVNKNNINTINAYKKWGFEIVESTIMDIGFGFVMDDYIMEIAFL